MIQAGNNPDTLKFICLCTGPFYFVLLEQYYTNIMNFPPINAVDDGVFVFVSWSIASAVYGSQIWDTKYDFFLYLTRLIDIVGYVVVRLMPFYAVIAWINIYTHRNSEHMQKVWNWTYFIA